MILAVFVRDSRLPSLVRTFLQTPLRAVAVQIGLIHLCGRRAELAGVEGKAGSEAEVAAQDVGVIDVPVPVTHGAPRAVHGYLDPPVVSFAAAYTV